MQREKGAKVIQYRQCTIARVPATWRAGLRLSRWIWCDKSIRITYGYVNVVARHSSEDSFEKKGTKEGDAPLPSGNLLATGLQKLHTAPTISNHSSHGNHSRQPGNHNNSGHEAFMLLLSPKGSRQGVGSADSALLTHPMPCKLQTISPVPEAVVSRLLMPVFMTCLGV